MLRPSTKRLLGPSTKRSSYLAGAAAALLIDRMMGEPPDRVHPVAIFGSLMSMLERRSYRPTRPAGVRYALVGISASTATAYAIEHIVKSVVPRRYQNTSRIVTTAIVGALCIAGRMLGDVATDIALPLGSDDIESARKELRSLVGRNPDTLDHEAISRAVTESVAENTVDAVIAPAMWAAIAGPAGVAAYRAINTLDAMVGHHSERYEHFGWASARLDDVASWIPARVTAALVSAVRPRTAREVVSVVTTDSPHHPSPNSGVAEGAFAAAINVQLGGVNMYGERIEDRGTLGSGRRPDTQGITDATGLLHDVTFAFAGLLGLASLISRVKQQ